MSVRKRVCFMLWTFLFAGVVFAAPPRSQRALWIETTERGNSKTTIAVTEGIARLVLESKDFKVNRSEKDGELITKKMLLAVLNGDEETMEASDEKGTAKIYTKKLSVPTRGNDNRRLVFETYESGDRKFRFVLPEIEINYSSDEGKANNYVNLLLGWKTLLPFLSKEGGALYIRDHDKDSEVWVYVE